MECLANTPKLFKFKKASYILYGATTYNVALIESMSCSNGYWGRSDYSSTGKRVALRPSAFWNCVRWCFGLEPITKIRRTRDKYYVRPVITFSVGGKLILARYNKNSDMQEEFS